MATFPVFMYFDIKTLIAGGKDDFSRPKNEALCCRMYRTRRQRRLGWKEGRRQQSRLLDER